MERRVLKNNKGLTLVEVLIAMVVFLLVSLAMMQTALVGIDSNMVNILRSEAVSIADERMSEARNLPFNDYVDLLINDESDENLNEAICPGAFIEQFGTNGEHVQRTFKNISTLDYCTNRDVVQLDNDNKRVSITVGWKWRGNDYIHSISTIVRKQ